MLQRGPVLEVDLVLAEVALALGVLDRAGRRRPSRCGSGGSPARPARCRGSSSRGCRGWPARGRGSPCARPRRRRLEEDELELGGGDASSPRSASRSSWRRRICRGEATTGEPSSQPRSARISAVPSLPRERPQRVEVGLHLEVAVAALPRRHRVAVDRVHLDVDGEQVVAGLGAVLERPRRGSGRGQPLALQAALHVREREQDGVDRAVAHRAAQLVQGSCLRSSDSASVDRVELLLGRRRRPGGGGSRGGSTPAPRRRRRAVMSAALHVDEERRDHRRDREHEARRRWSRCRRASGRRARGRARGGEARCGVSFIST